MSRKSKANIGSFSQSVPERSTAYDSVMLPERIMLTLLRDTISQLKDNKEELTRFFAHFFESTAGSKEVDEFVTHFMKNPPKAILGYARSSAQFPCFAIVMENEDEDTSLLADFVGQDDEDVDSDSPSEFSGAIFKATYAIYIYAEHPDACGYLYQFAKAVVHAGKPYLMSAGAVDITISGGDLAPDEVYMPENMFMRVLRATMLVPMTVPRILTAHPKRIRITGISHEDTVVDGVRGGVTVEEGNDG